MAARKVDWRMCSIRDALYSYLASSETPDPGCGRRCLNVAIAKGWSVAISNHLGPPRTYGAAKLGGQITLGQHPRRQAIRRTQPRREPVEMAGIA